MAYPTTTEHPRVYPWTSIMASPYSCDPTGTLDCASAIEQLKAYQANTGTIHIPKGTFSIATSLTIPIGMALRFEAGSKFIVATGKTLTINGSLEAGFHQIFSCVGTGKVVFGAESNKIVYPKWWGADDTGVVDATAALLAAIHAGPNVVDLGSGTFMVRQVADPCVINIARSNLLITGKDWTLINHSDIDAGGFVGFEWYMFGVYGNTVPVENIVIENGTLKGNITTTMYQVLQQQRHGLYFGTGLSTIKNVTVRNMFMDNHGGDGIYLGSNVIGYHEENVRYRDCLRSSWVLAGTGGCEDVWVNESKELAATKTSGRIGNVSINAAGTGYAVNDILTVVQAGASVGTLKVASIGAGGEVLTVNRVTEGNYYSVANGLATTVVPAGGSGCTVNVLSMAFTGTSFHVEINAGGTSTANNIWLTNLHSLRGVSATTANLAARITGVVIRGIRGEGTLTVIRCTKPVLDDILLSEPVGWITNDYLGDLRSLTDPIINKLQLIATTGAAACYVSRGSGDSLSASLVDNWKFKDCNFVSKSTTVEGFYAINQNGITLDNVTVINSGYIAGRVYNCINPRVIGGKYDSTGASADALRVFAAATSLAYRTVAEIRGVTAKADTGFYDIYTNGVRRISIGNIADKYFNGSANQDWPARYGGGIGKFYRDTAPDYGVWKVGDRRYRANATLGEAEGAICTTAGAGTLGAWSNATTYYIGDFVTRGGNYYESLQNANLNKDPATEPTWWIAQGAVLAIWSNLTTIPNAVTTPAVPATTVQERNDNAFPIRVTITGGTVTVIAKGPTSGALITTGATTGAFILQPKEYIAITYTVIPTWVWLGM